MIEVWTGKTGTGKSANLANKILHLLYRNLRWAKKTGKVRPILTNIKLSDELEEKFNNLDFNDGQFNFKADFIRYWSEVEQLVTATDCDIIWDEIATNLDSSQWQNTPLSVKRFLAQHRKRGINIYGTSQRFGSIEINMRALVDHVWICYKIFGTRNPSATTPVVKHPWAFIWSWAVDPLKFEEEKREHIGWDFLFVDKEIINAYDTTQEIEQGKFPPLHHVDRVCIDPNCKFHRVTHY